MSKTYTKLLSGVVGGAIDLHAWVETNDGNVIDEQNFMKYRYVKDIHNLNDKTHYCELVGESKKEVWKQIWKQIIKPRLKLHKELRGITEQQFWDEFAETPHEGMCFINAYAYHLKNPKTTRMCLGKMGWEYKNKEGVWWEYG